MTGSKKITGRTIKHAATATLLAALLFTCEKIPDHCGNGYSPLNPAAEFCGADGAKYAKCGGKEYRPEDQKCDYENGILLTQCPGGKDFHNPVTHFCEDGEMHRRCGGAAYNTSAQVCLGSEVRTPCDGGRTVPAGQPCDGYILSTTAAPAEGGTVEPATQSYTPGALVGVTAKAADGYTFTGWSGASTATSPTISVTMDGDKSLVAIFSPVVTDTTSYCLTITVIPNNSSGTVTRNPDKQCYDPGTPVTVTAEAAQNYRFAGWGGASNSSDLAIVVTMDGPRALIANFALITYILTIDRNITAGGTVSASSQSGITPGTPFSISAFAASGYAFVNWTVASGQAAFGDPNDASTTVTLGSNATIRANFQQLYALTMSCSPTEGGTTTPANSQSGITADTPVNISAAVANGYTFVNWTIASGTAMFGNANSASTTVTLGSNATIRANFQYVIVSGSFTDSRDNRSYRTVQIGQQRWMAENLNYNASGSVCHSNQESNCNTYGRLYDWTTVMNGASSSTSSPSGVRGVCPVGWHVPSDAEWTALTNAVGGSSTAGTKLKSKSGWYSNGNGTDDHGFSALPGGIGYSYVGGFDDAGFIGLWWSATEDIASYAWHRRMGYNYDFVGRSNYHTAILFSLRCVEDSAAPQ